MKRIAALLGAVLVSLSLPAGTVPQPTDLTAQFRTAGVVCDRLQAFEIGGVVVIRGRTYDRASAEYAGQVAQNLGYKRVANLVQVMDRPDDAAIERMAERVLCIHPSLNGAKLHVESRHGVVRVGGMVTHELQKDVALRLLRNIDGVVEVHSDLKR